MINGSIIVRLSRAKEQAVDFIVKESQALGMTWSIVRPTLYVKVGPAKAQLFLDDLEPDEME